MRITLKDGAILALRAKLDAFKDAEATGPDEYVADFYDFDPPFSLELALEPDGVSILAAEYLSYDETLDGFYLSGPLQDIQLIERALETL